MYELYRPAAWEIPKDFLSFEHFCRVVRTKIDWQSSPGYPYLLDAPTNGRYLEVVDGEPSQAAMRRLWTLVERRLELYEADPIRLFIKPEPHKLKKLEKHAYRLISSVSLVDQVVDQMLFSPMNEKMVAECLNLPSKVGWSPYKGGWKLVPKNWLSLDKTAWDWGMQPWLFELLLLLRHELCVSNPELKNKWLELASKRYQLLFRNPEFITSGGLVFTQKEPGVQKSGCVNTITDNTLAQDILHIRACFETNQEVTAQWAMGDDTYVEPPRDLRSYREQLAQYCSLKEGLKKGEFAGFRFLSNSIEPMYVGKHAFNLLHHDENNVDFLPAYHLLYGKSTNGLLKRSLMQMSPVNGEWVRAIWVGED